MSNRNHNIYPVSRELNKAESIISACYFLLIFIYISSFWGKAASYFPTPIDKWVYVYLPLLKNWWVLSVFQDYPYLFRLHMMWYFVCFIMALIIPSIIIKLLGRKLSDYGLGLPNKLGFRITLLSIVVSIPFGLWLVLESPYTHELSKVYFLSLLSKIPEHFVICGILIGLMVPGRILPNPIYFSKVEGSKLQRFLKLLGLAQTGEAGSNSRILNWFGINWSMLTAIIFSAFLFWSIHWGRANYVEVYTSLPGGIAIAYVTIRTHSIWPTVIAHWTLNLIPMGLIFIFR